jgi:N-acetylglucosamine kinase-like BadF-type ATPase
MNEQYFLGVDGGGTKTAFLILDEAGRTRGQHEGPTSYHLQIGLDGLRAVLTNGVAAALKAAALSADDLTRAFFGLPAHGEDSRIQPALDAMPAEILGHDRYTCGNDMVCGWAGSLACADGINIVAGTGSIGYGECGGHSARAGGWGELFGDEGSAYWIAVQGLNIFSRMSDGRVPKGPLYASLKQEFALADDLDLSGLLTDSASAARNDIAALSKLVAAAADAGDLEARRIFDAAAQELALIIDAIGSALPFEAGQRVPVSYSGGVFGAGALVFDPLRAALGRLAHNYDLVQPRFAPSVGAALYAAKLSGAVDINQLAERLSAGR